MKNQIKVSVKLNLTETPKNIKIDAFKGLLESLSVLLEEEKKRDALKKENQ